jgi:hypothetical protein
MRKTTRKIFITSLIILLSVSQVFAVATFSRIKIWTAETLTASDLNAEFDNILNNFAPTGIDDYSTTEGQMQIVADPYPGGATSLATSLQGELERMRYILKQLGRSQWYIDPYGWVIKSANYTATSDDFLVMVNETATVTLPSASSMANKYQVFKNIGTGIVAIDANSTETIDGSLTASLMNQNDVKSLFSNGTSWQVINKVSSAEGGLRDDYRALTITNTTNYIINASIAEAILQDTTNNVHKVYSMVNQQASILNSGVSGLDTGSAVGSTWYHIWGISNSTSTGLMFSTSSSAPTMPSTYVYKAYLGAVYNSASAGIKAMYQKDKRVVMEATVALNTGSSATSYTAINLSAVVPSTAVSISGDIGVGYAAGTDNMYFYIASTVYGLGRKYHYQDDINSELQALYWGFDLTLVEAQTMYYFVRLSNMTVDINISGWEY